MLTTDRPVYGDDEVLGLLADRLRPAAEGWLGRESNDEWLKLRRELVEVVGQLASTPDELDLYRVARSMDKRDWLVDDAFLAAFRDIRDHWSDAFQEATASWLKRQGTSPAFAEGDVVETPKGRTRIHTVDTDRGLYLTDAGPFRWEQIADGARVCGEAIYDNEVAPLLRKAGELCLLHKFPFLALVQYGPENEDVGHVAFGDGGPTMVLSRAAANSRGNIDAIALAMARDAGDTHGSIVIGLLKGLGQ